MKVQAVIFDWAGTTVDPGSLAPVRAIQRVFAKHEISVAEDDARRDMGLAKREHIRRILAANGTMDPNAVETYYAEFAAELLESLHNFSAVISGVPDVVRELRRRGIAIGSTTGYTRAMLDVVAARAKREGYEPDCSVTPEEAGAGRPHPDMMHVAATRLRRSPLAHFVKVGDTPVDIEEGLNAGAWAVGVSETGNSSAVSLKSAGAHFVVASAADLLPVIDTIERRLASGDRP